MFSASRGSIRQLCKLRCMFDGVDNQVGMTVSTVTVPIQLRCSWHEGGGGGGLVVQSCLTLETPWTVASKAPLSVGFPRQEYWSGLPFLSPGELPDPEIEPRPPALQVDSLLSY